MIVGVPEFAELHDTAVGWLNLAWEIAIREVGVTRRFVQNSTLTIFRLMIAF
jgi:hypothetical protein